MNCALEENCLQRANDYTQQEHLCESIGVRQKDCPCLLKNGKSVEMKTIL